MALIVHRAERADVLVAALAGVLATPLDDPFAAEIVAVPSRGIERWLSQQLSNLVGASAGRGDGICANVEMPFPGRLVGRALAAATGVEADGDPWAPARAVWPLLEIVDEHLDDAWLAALAAHAVRGTDGAPPTARFGIVRHVADLFDRYAVHRPAMIVRWAAGDDVDGRGVRLPADLAWQPALWRLLRARVDTASPAERLEPACTLLRAEPRRLDLPPRLALFGLTRLAPSMLRVLDAVGAARDVHLLLLHPSPAWWSRTAEPEPPTRPASQLLATWGRDARSMQAAIAASVETPRMVHHPAAGALPGTLLGRLQADVRDDRRPPGEPAPGAVDERLPLDPTDTSVQIHSCTGRARQVEVLRDALLHLFADDPTLEPRDVIVMCPDIEVFAPLVQATFGAESTGADGLPHLEVRLADRAVRQVNPVLAAVSALLALAAGRVTAPELVDFAGLEPVRRRFRLDDDALARIEEWVADAGVRWGLDAEHRRPFKLDVLQANTWRAGLDRLLLGVSMAEDDEPLVGGVLPLDDVESGDIALVGRLAELVDRIHAAVTACQTSRTATGWAQLLAATADGLFSCAPNESWQRRELDELLAEIADEAGDPEATSPTLTLAELRTLLGQRLAGRPSRANFRTGHLTVCTLVPMRSVPHRVICLLGLDDGAFPRHGAPDGDDIVGRTPQAGDHDVRSEDRQLLLDALLAAGDHLLVTYSGRDERTTATRPPAVPIGELLDVIEATARATSGSARRQVLTEHPLQSFDARNFVDGEIVDGGPWSFDASALRGAAALARARRGVGHHGPRPFLAAPLSALDGGVVELDDLVAFLQHPTKAFLRRRLSISLGDFDDDLAADIPVELDGLDQWRIGQRLLDSRLAGMDWDAAIAAERARGLLPPGPLGGRVLDQVLPAVRAIADAALQAIGGAPAEQFDVAADLGRAGVVVGTVGGVRQTTLVQATYSKLSSRLRLATWARLLTLTASNPDRQWNAVTVGRDRQRAMVARLGGLDAAAAVGHLEVLVDLYQRGMREPLPIYPATSEAIARRRPGRSEWQTEGLYDREDRDPEHVFVLGEEVPFARLAAERPRADEAGPGWAGDEPTRLGRYAHRLWDGLLASEQRDSA